MAETRRLTVTVPEVAELLGVSRNTAYESVARGEIPHIRLGRRILIPRSRLEELLASGDGAKDPVSGSPAQTVGLGDETRPSHGTGR